MSGAKSRRKGVVGEREAALALSELWPGLQRTFHQARGGDEAPDIDGPGCPVWLEVKRAERLNLHAAMAQASKASDGRPAVVIHRRSRGPWLVTMAAQTFVDLMGDAAARVVAYRPAVSSVPLAEFEDGDAPDEVSEVDERQLAMFEEGKR